MTDWGQSLSLVYERLRQANARLQTDRTESRAALARVADSLEREARRLPVHSIEPVSGETSGTHGPSSRAPGPGMVGLDPPPASGESQSESVRCFCRRAANFSRSIGTGDFGRAGRPEGRVADAGDSEKVGFLVTSIGRAAGEACRNAAARGCAWVACGATICRVLQCAHSSTIPILLHLYLIVRIDRPRSSTWNRVSSSSQLQEETER